MITDKDIEKLKVVFATKDDLKAMEGRQDKKFATKDDLKIGLNPIKKDISNIKHDISNIHQDLKTVNKKLDDLTEYVVPTIGSILKWTDDIHLAIVGKKSTKQIPEN